MPPARFGRVTFADFESRHPSQETARRRLQERVADAARPPRPRWPWQRRRPEGHGLFLDGGFGVGKTHLLAAAWHEAPLPPEAKAYLSFAELVHRVGADPGGTRDALAGVRLLCLDEFELDDPGNTLIVKSFLQAAFARGALVVTTSNTPPSAQGEGRFDAHAFRREIQSIAARFETLRVDGPDGRLGSGAAVCWNDEAALARAAASGPDPVRHATGDELRAALAAHHPSRYGRLLDEVGTLLLEDLAPLPSLPEALRFVHFVDRLYERDVRLRATSAAGFDELFGPEYADGAFEKKFDRCLSRLATLLREPLAP